MSNQEFENYLSLIGKLLQLTRDQRDQIAGELRDHLELRVADLVNEGAIQRDAITQALEEFGDAAAMAKNFQTVLNHKRRRWMMRFATFSIAGSFLAAILVMAMWPDDARFGSPSASRAQGSGSVSVGEIVGEISDGTTSKVMQGSRTMERNLRTEEILKGDVDINFDAELMSDVVAEFSESKDLNFIFDESALMDGLTHNELVTIKLRNISLGKALEFILKPFNATYVIDEGVIVLISIDDADSAEFMQLRMYNCQDLLDALPANTTASPVDLARPTGTPRGGGGVFNCQDVLDALPNSTTANPVELAKSTGGGGLISGTPATPTTSDEGEAKLVGARAKEAVLLSTIRSMVNPDGWVDTGTGLSQSKMYNGVLLIKAPQKTFQEIDNLLIDLRSRLLDK